MPVVSPENVVSACQLPVPTRYCVVQPAGAGIVTNVIDVIVLLASCGAVGAPSAGTVMLLLSDHKLSVATLNGAIPL